MIDTTEFHIHVDAFDLSFALGQLFESKFGFRRTDFAGHPEGTEGFEPKYHLTLKVRSGAEFHRVYQEVLDAARITRGLKGYVEGEFVALDEVIEKKEYDPSIVAPFKVALGTLPPSSFRESEIHVTTNLNGSHPELLERLSEMGLFSAYLPKRSGIAQVFTLQGKRRHIHQLLKSLHEYLKRAGGAAQCSIKEERVVAWWLSDPEVQLPPVVRRISWLP